MDTRTKAATRILTHLTPGTTLRQATDAAIAEATTEARQLGWSLRTQTGLAATFTDVAVEMAATTARAAR